jgi:hypothetical protein
MKLPEKYLKRILELKDWLSKQRYDLPVGDPITEELFDIYNTYISTSNRIEESSCANCRAKLKYRMNQIIEQYGG